MKNIAAVAFAIILTGCKTITSGDVASQMKRCAASEALPDVAILYTGPVGFGPGSEWVKLESRSVVIGAEVKDIWNPPPDFFGASAPSAICNVGANSKLDLGAAFGADVSTLPISGKLQADLSNAKVISITAEGVSWEWIKYIVYRNEILKLPESSPFRSQPGKLPILIALGMLKVSSYTATLDINGLKKAEITSNYSGVLPASLTGELKASVIASYDNQGHLRLSVSSPTYIAGYFYELDAMLGRAGAPLPPGPIVQEPSITPVKVIGRRD